MTIFKKLNRIKSTTPTKKLFWCSRCDANKVGQHGKCSVCGHIQSREKKK